MLMVIFSIEGAGRSLEIPVMRRMRVSFSGSIVPVYILRRAFSDRSETAASIMSMSTCLLVVSLDERSPGRINAHEADWMRALSRSSLL